ncbi:hypothetical protein [Nocardia spumae]|uniref:hypothetical protein n=1 Tax=Nocardia spumae TaxID=2887190 RepID=UPI001D13F24A|nr:hypothetical protein [Nocardia spumae]
MIITRVLPTVAVTLAIGALGVGAATAAPLSLEPATVTTSAATPGRIADSGGPLGSGSASGSNEPGSILCWLLHPSPTCQL